MAWLVVALLAPVLGAYVALQVRGIVLGTNASYDAYKVFAVFQPVLLPALCWWSRPGHEPAVAPADSGPAVGYAHPMGQTWINGAADSSVDSLLALRPDLAERIDAYDRNAAAAIGPRLRTLLEIRAAQLLRHEDYLRTAAESIPLGKLGEVPAADHGFHGTQALHEPVIALLEDLQGSFGAHNILGSCGRHFFLLDLRHVRSPLSLRLHRGCGLQELQVPVVFFRVTKAPVALEKQDRKKIGRAHV